MAIQVWKTPDGAIFETHEPAQAHEKELFDKWLDLNPQIPAKDLIASANDDDDDDFYGTHREYLYIHLKNYWARCVGKTQKEQA